MKKNGNFDISFYKTWYKNKKDYAKKTKLMKEHFGKVVDCDAILVVNLEKNGIKGHIGRNVLMEMALAFYFRKPIFVYNSIDESLNTREEAFGLNPIFLNGDLKLIEKYL